MEQQVKVVLNEISEDPIRLGVLLTGKRVQLAEDLSKFYLRPSHPRFSGSHLS